MGLHDLSQEASIAHHFIAELRDTSIQQDPMRFRYNLARLGEVLAYEISKTLAYQAVTVPTVLGKASVQQLPQLPILLTVLRAGLPFFEGFQRIFDRSECGFVGAYRAHQAGDEEAFTIDLGYRAAPSLAGKDVILIDPMLATGQSLLAAMETLADFGTPTHWHIAAAIAAPEGIERLQQEIKAPFTLWVGAVDDHLNNKAYIVPGLGDAGDLAYGSKQ